jgi:hypothetical protein
MTPEPIQIRVLREAGAWKVKYEDVVLDYESHDRALAAGIALARTFGREGRSSAVVMGMITTLYGPDGFIQTVPNRKKSDLRTPLADELPSAPHLDMLLQVDASPLAPETPAAIAGQPNGEQRRKLTEEKQPRLLKIASALAALDEP